jgi:hypothetical protein
VQSAGGAIYLRATQPIPPTRLQLQDVDSGALILLDIAAEPAKAGQAALEPVRIVDGETAAVRYGEQAASVAKTDDEESPDNAASRARRRETPVAVVLTRYAAQNLYAPLRTVEPVAGIARVNLRRELALDTLLPTLTAVGLVNTTARALELDPRALQGDFVAATFQHASLGPAGQSTDTTVVYLVTRGHGLADSLLPKISRIDATVNLPAAGAAGAAGAPRAAQGAGDEK